MAGNLSRRELIRKLRALGFIGPFSGGKHQFMAKGERKVRIPNPHGKGDVSSGLVNEIRKQANIKQQDWDAA
jgi:predicted RNA binding protein YcfA (HicA-like mRNA interferase family)